MTANKSFPLPQGCSRSAHVAVLSYLAQLYAIGNCPDDNAYFVQKLKPF